MQTALRWRLATVEASHPLLWAPNFSKGVYFFRKALSASC